MVVGKWELWGQILLYQSGSEKKSMEKISLSPDFIVKQYNKPKADTQRRFIYATVLPRHNKLSPHCLIYRGSLCRCQLPAANAGLFDLD